MSFNSRRKPLLEFRTTAPSPRLALALLRAAALNGQSAYQPLAHMQELAYLAAD